VEAVACPTFRHTVLTSPYTGANRIVGGRVLAGEAFITESMGCGAPGEQPLQLLLLQKALRERLPPTLRGGQTAVAKGGRLVNTPAAKRSQARPKSILLIKRDRGQRSTGLTLDFVQVLHVVEVFLRMNGLQQNWIVEVCCSLYTIHEYTIHEWYVAPWLFACHA
jgi:hypothetical protein